MVQINQCTRESVYELVNQWLIVHQKNKYNLWFTEWTNGNSKQWTSYPMHHLTNEPVNKCASEPIQPIQWLSSGKSMDHWNIEPVDQCINAFNETWIDSWD